MRLLKQNLNICLSIGLMILSQIAHTRPGDNQNAFAASQKRVSSPPVKERCWAFLGYGDSTHTIKNVDEANASSKPRSMCLTDDHSIKSGWDGGNFFDGSYKIFGEMKPNQKNSFAVKIGERTKMAGHDPVKEDQFVEELEKTTSVILLEGGNRLVLVSSSGKELIFTLFNQKSETKTPIVDVAKKLVGSGPWMFVGYSKNTKLEKDFGRKRGIYFNKQCLLERNARDIIVADYSLKDVSIKAAKNLLSPLYISGLEILEHEDRIVELEESERRRYQRFNTMIQQVIGVAELSDSNLVLQLMDGQRLEFVKPNGEYLEYLKTKGCK